MFESLMISGPTGSRPIRAWRLLQAGHEQGMVAGEFFVCDREPRDSTIDDGAGLEDCFAELDRGGAWDHEMLAIQVVFIKLDWGPVLNRMLQYIVALTDQHPHCLLGFVD